MTYKHRSCETASALVHRALPMSCWYLVVACAVAALVGRCWATADYQIRDLQPRSPLSAEGAEDRRHTGQSGALAAL